MTRISKRMASVALKNRRHGYVFVNQIRHGSYPVYTCELELRSASQKVTLTLSIYELDRVGKTYSFSLFSDEDRKSLLLEAFIDFYDENTLTMHAETAMVEERIEKLSDSLLNFIHVVVAYVIAKDRAPRGKNGALSEWYFGFRRFFASIVRESLGTSIDDLVSDLSPLLV